MKALSNCRYQTTDVIKPKVLSDQSYDETDIIKGFIKPKVLSNCHYQTKGIIKQKHYQTRGIIKQRHYQTNRIINLIIKGIIKPTKPETNERRNSYNAQQHLF